MNNTPLKVNENEEESTNLLPLLKYCYAQFLANWGWFLLSAILCLGIGWFYQQCQSRVYQRQAVMLIEDINQSTSFSRQARRGNMSLMDLNGISVGDNLKNEMFILTSLRLMEHVVADLGLQTDYTMKKSFHTVALYKDTPLQVVFNTNTDDLATFNVTKLNDHEVELADFTVKGEKAGANLRAKIGQTVKTPAGQLAVVRADAFDEMKQGDEISVTRMPRKVAAGLFQGKVTASSYDKESSLIVLQCNDINAERAEDVLNAVFNAYKRDVVENKNRVAQSTMQFIDERVGLIGTELSQVETQLVNFKRANHLVDFEKNAQLFLTETSAARKATLEMETQLNVAQYLAEYLSNHANDRDLIPALNFTDGDFNSQIQQYNTLMNERNRLAENVHEDQLAVREKDRVLKQLRTSILASVKSYVRTTELRLRDARANESTFASRITSAPETEKEGLDIKRQQVLKEALYNYLLNKREEVAMQLAINEANVRLVEMPLGPNAPVSPRRSIILLVSLLIGIVIPAGIIYLRHLLDVSVNGRRDIETLTTIPLLGEVPHMDDAENRAADISRMEQDDPVVEAFRILRYSMNFMNREAKVITATSCTPDQGKSFVMKNLSVVLSLSGKRVLLIDGDIRKRSLSHQYGRSAGLTGLLSDTTLSVEQAVLKNAVAENVDFMPAGMLPPNPSELLMSSRLDDVMEECKRLYDYVILDSTPMLQVADAGIVNRVADLTLFVVRVGVQERAFLPELEKMYKDHRFKQLCIVLNDVDTNSSRYATYGYGYGYGYGRSNTSSSSRKKVLLKRLTGK